MGRDTLTSHADRDLLFEEICSRREREGKSFWPRAQWDYTEWDEALDELKNRLKDRVRRIDVV